MKNMFKSLFVVILVSLLSLNVGCKKSKDEGPDTEKPTVTFVSPVASGSYNRGANLPLDATFKDNKALKKCTVSLDYNGTIPGTSNLKSATGIEDPWTPADDVITFTGLKEETITKNLFGQAIEGACAPGSYTLTYVIEDEAGNSNTVEVDITIN